MDSGYSTISSTYLSDQLTDFVDYVYSFYGDKKEASWDNLDYDYVECSDGHIFSQNF